MPGITAGETITAVGDHRAGRRLRRRRHPHDGARSADGGEWVLERHQALHHQRRPRRPLFRRRQDRLDGAATRCRCSSSRRARRASRSAAQLDKTRLAARPTPPSWCSTTAASRPRTCSARRTRGFYSVMKNFQTERIALAAMAVGHSMQALAADARRTCASGSAFGAPLFDKQVGAPAPRDARRQGARRARASCTTAPGASRRAHDVVQEVSMLKALTGELVNEVVAGLPAVPRRHGLHARHGDRAALARRARPRDRRRRDRGDARRGRQALQRRWLTARALPARLCDGLRLPLNRPRQLLLAGTGHGHPRAERPLLRDRTRRRRSPASGSNRPDVRNAFNGELDRASSRGLRRARDRRRRCARSSSAARGKAFCAGADLALDARGRPTTPGSRTAPTRSALAEMLWTIVPLPGAGRSARIHGDCYAGGLGLALGLRHPRRRRTPRPSRSAKRGSACCRRRSARTSIRAMGEQAARRYFVTAERFGAAEAGAMRLRRTRCARPTAHRRDGRRARRPRSSPTGRWRRARASSWCRTSPAARSRAELRAETARRIADIRASAGGQGRHPELPATSASPGVAGRQDAMNLDLTQLVAIAAALGWASGLRLYAVVCSSPGSPGWLGWIDAAGRPARRSPTRSCSAPAA